MLPNENSVPSWRPSFFMSKTWNWFEIYKEFEVFENEEYK
ncbi:hypothetical protein J699_00082 [Acinetobacter sp. 1000160]|nr:hypothetical protein J522_2020 [Acinetobacter baumannii 146457]EYT23702.1 hypothetical protein J699_00082 [Acinetobacter sp. 1000160]